MYYKMERSRGGKYEYGAQETEPKRSSVKNIRC